MSRLVPGLNRRTGTFVTVGVTVTGAEIPPRTRGPQERSRARLIAVCDTAEQKAPRHAYRWASTRMEKMMKLNRRSFVIIVPAAAAGVVALAGCSSGGTSYGGGGGTQSSTAASGAGTGGGATTVSVVRAGGSQLLTDKAGRALYVNDQERQMVMCKSSACTSIWVPLTTASAHGLTAPAALSRQLGTIRRPDGTLQITLNGKPLYTFTFDHAAGQVSGNGAMDSFDGTNFTWHAAAPRGASAVSSSSSGSNGYGHGGGY